MVLLICVRLPLIVLLAATSKCTSEVLLVALPVMEQLPVPGSKVITAVYLETPSDAHDSQIFKVLDATGLLDAIGYGSYPPLGPQFP